MGTQKGIVGTQSVATTVPWCSSQLGGVLAWAAMCLWSAGHFGLTSCPWVSHPKPAVPQPREAGPVTRENGEALGLGADARWFFPLCPHR